MALFVGTTSHATAAELAREEHVWIGVSTVNCILVPPGSCHGSTQLVNNDVKYNFSRIETAEDKLAGPIVRWGHYRESRNGHSKAMALHVINKHARPTFVLQLNSKLMLELNLWIFVT